MVSGQASLNRRKVSCFKTCKPHTIAEALHLMSRKLLTLLLLLPLVLEVQFYCTVHASSGLRCMLSRHHTSTNPYIVLAHLYVKLCLPTMHLLSS